MKNYFKTSKWLRFVAAGAFGLMLVLNIMISLDFDKDKLLPSLTLVELGNQAFAQDSEDDGGWECEEVSPGSTICENENGDSYGWHDSTLNQDGSCSGSPADCRILF